MSAAAAPSPPITPPPPPIAMAAGGWRCRRWAALLVPVLVAAVAAATAVAAAPAVLVPVTAGVGVPPGAPAAPGARDDGAHAVPGSGYTVIDMDGTGAAKVALDGSGSHTHNGGEEGVVATPGKLGPESGYGGVVALTWSVVGSGVVIGTGPTPRAVFPVGTTTVLLTVKDWAGDVHAATTTVVVRGDTTPGLWCYYTPDKAPGGKATHASAALTVRFGSAAAFGVPFASGPGGWTARCVGSYLAKTTGLVSFGLLADGGTATLSVRRQRLSLSAAPGPAVVMRTASVSLPAGLHPIEVTYTRPAGAAKPPRLILNVPSWLLSHQDRTLLPTLAAVAPETGDLAGGFRLTLRGTALARASAVRIGGVPAEVVTEPLARQQQATAATRMTVVVPRGAAAGRADVVVVTPTGESNPVPYTYVATRVPPEVIAWRTTTLRTADGSKNFPLRAGTSAALGPDMKLYVGCAAGGQLYRLTVDWLTHRVMASCSTWLGGQILGVSFNPVDVGRGLPQVYVSVGNLTVGAPWAGGRVLRLSSLPSGGCFSAPTTVVSGLPVQVGHDHSIGRPAYTETGDMLLPVGGVTNNGVPHPASGSLDESPLSASIVKVPLSKPGFDGRIRYSTSDAATARVTGGDVTVWASGVRNGLFLERHSVSGTYWILDNGPNLGYGDVSRTCTVTTPMDPAAPPAQRRDKLLHVTPGGYYGHPNRNRGRDDARQCTYRLPTERAAGYTPSLADFEPSSNGVAEMRVNLYRGALKGHLFFSRFASGGDGLLRASNVSPGGVLVGGASAIRTVKYFSGLSITVSPYGALVMPRVRQGHAAVLIPIYKRTPDAGPLILSVTPNRGPRRGGYRVWVAGYNWGVTPPVVKVGNRPCTGVVVGKAGLHCTIPEGRGKLAVFVNGVRGGTGHDFEYLDV